MIPEEHFDSFIQYITSVDLPLESKREVERFVSMVIDLPASSIERIHEAFLELRRVFSEKTVAAAPDLPARIASLETVSIEAARINAVAHEQLGGHGEAPQAAPAPIIKPPSPPALEPEADARAVPAGNIEPPSPPCAPAAGDAEESESSDSEGELPRRGVKREAQEPLEGARKKRNKDNAVEQKRAQPAQAAAHEESQHSALARARWLLLRTHNGAQNSLPFHDGTGVHAIWANHAHNGGLVISIQKSEDFQSGASQANKLSFTLDRFGHFLSIWENGQDTHSLVLPEKWAPTLQTAIKTLDELYRDYR
jgi:hypothetical protein